MKLKFLAYIVVITFFVISPAAAQAQPSPIINASNIRQLQSVAQIDFDNLPEEAGKVENGWFAVNTNGERLSTVNSYGGVILWDLQLGMDSMTVAICGDDGKPGTFIDGGFEPSEVGEVFVAAYQVDQIGSVAYHPFDVHPSYRDKIPVVVCELPFLPIRVWIDAPWSGALTPYTWIEFFSSDGTSSIEYFDIFNVDVTGNTYGKFLPSGPENDTDSFLRIGRIDPPLAITATQDALLKRWNLETGEVTATAQIDSLPAAGQVNPDGTSLAWVDQEFESLHLLNFEIGVDKVIAPLNGTYIPFLLLSAQADVIIGVNVGLEPDVVAWDVATGARIDLGEYRACNRQPDMVRLSRDGSTLVIGCDTGLDIWRVPANN